jgi:hypothetical protein
MGVNKDRVMKYIEQNFDLAEWDLEDWPILPGGTLLKCKQGGSVLVWSDLDDNICYSINGEPAVKVRFKGKTLS